MLWRDKNNKYRPILLSGQNARWPRRMRLPGEYGKYPDGTDGHTPDRYISLSTKRISVIVIIKDSPVRDWRSILRNWRCANFKVTWHKN